MQIIIININYITYYVILPLFPLEHLQSSPHLQSLPQLFLPSWHVSFETNKKIINELH